jgi:hypothetical protein
LFEGSEQGMFAAARSARNPCPLPGHYAAAVLNGLFYTAYLFIQGGHWDTATPLNISVGSTCHLI